MTERNQNLTAAETAERLRISPVTLAQWRVKGIGPEYIKAGGRVLYREEDVSAFETSRVRQKTRGPN